MKPNKRMAMFGLAVLTLSSMASPALACPDGQGGQGGGQGQSGRRSPPPEALAACSGAGESQACQFEAPHGTVTGTCMNIQNQMACVPAGGPGGPPQGGQSPQGA